MIGALAATSAIVPRPAAVRAPHALAAGLEVRVQV